MSAELDKYKARLARAEEKIRILEEMIETKTLELYTKNTELEKKNREMEQFSYISSHDLQEPLRTVSNFADLLSRNYSDKLDETARKSFEFIQEATGRMRALIKGLLDYSQLGRDKTVKLTDCNKIVQEVISDLGGSIEQVHASIKVGTLPHINAYEVELRLLFQNLISNAIKFRRSHVPLEVFVTAERNADEWKFCVKDNGIGIEKSFLHKIFILFQRLHGRKEYEGIGIGLAHCKKIAELHRGDIWVESESGAGSAFFFTIKDLSKTAL
jgi:light-regulated signal transduction histidine kinase (bacteriophytochrome)